MGREVRMVPEKWNHPKNQDGRYDPLFDNFEKDIADWQEEKEQWDRGYQKSYDNYKLKDKNNLALSYEEWAGEAPDPKNYMPTWKPEEKTHYMMYETTTEGTPISPAFETPEELAKWLSDNNASAFADKTAAYEEWLNMIKEDGYAPSAVVENGELKSGVSAMNKKYQSNQRTSHLIF